MITNKKRVEQIEKYAEEYSKSARDSNPVVGEVFNQGIIAGAKWADENPKYTKDDFINEAKEFLKMNLDNMWGGSSCYFGGDLERFIWEFEKWMK